MLIGYIKDLTINNVHTLRSVHIPKIFIACDQADAAPVWDYILQEGLNVILETSPHEAVGHWLVEIPDVVVIDIDVAKQDPIDLYNKFRVVSVAPILLFLPTHRESKILEAYAAGVYEVIIKPISAAMCLAKIKTWVRRTWMIPVADLTDIKAGRHKLEPASGLC